MNLAKLFETQKKLDERIYERFPGLKEEPWDWKVLALQVELGELANEWRGFKRWSEDREPRTVLFRWEDAFGKTHESPTDPSQLVENFLGNDLREVNPLLEEYVDCLHFILSIGLEHEFEKTLSGLSIERLKTRNITEQLTLLMRTDWELYEEGDGGYYHEGFELFLTLGEVLDFTGEQVAQAYYEKNKINHERQENNY